MMLRCTFKGLGRRQPDARAVAHKQPRHAASRPSANLSKEPQPVIRCRPLRASASRSPGRKSAVTRIGRRCTTRLSMKAC
jgi:hypothetical protein